jgi:hypothetical protein
MKAKKVAPSQYAPKPEQSSFKKFAHPGSVLKKKINPVVDQPSFREGSLGYKECPSKNTVGGSTAAKEVVMYTGDLVKGISLVHKSGFMPVFTDEQAVDFANMRR